MSRKIVVVSLLALAALTGACTRKAEAPKELNLAIWANYISENARAKFARETGIELKVMTYSSNEELLAKIQAGGSGIDVAVPSDYMVDVMTKLDLLQPIEKSAIPAAAHLAKEFLAQPYDPENKFSLPYGWTTAGIAINRELYKEPVKSWKDFFENPKLAGKISLLDDVREVAAAVLKMQGQSANTTDKAALDKAKAQLLKIRKNVKMFSSDVIGALKGREVAAAHAYSPDSLQAAAAPGDRIEFVIPEEGGTRAIDNLVILKTAKDPAMARKLIDFLLTKENNVAFVEKIRGGPVVEGVRPLLSPRLRDDKALFPTPAVFSKLESLRDLGEANRLYEELWTEVKTGE